MGNRRKMVENNECVVPHYVDDPNQVLDDDLVTLREVYQASVLVNLWVKKPLDLDALKEKDEYGLILDEDRNMGDFLRRQVRMVEDVLGKLKRPDSVEVSPRIAFFCRAIKADMNVNRTISKVNVDRILRRFSAECHDVNIQRVMNNQRSQIGRRVQSIDSVFHERKCDNQGPAEFFGLAHPQGELPDKLALCEGATILRHAFKGYRRGVDPKKMGFSDFPGQVYMQFHFTPTIGSHWSIGFCGIDETEMLDLKALMLELWLDVYPKGHLLTPHLTGNSVSDAKKYLVSCMSHKTLITPSLPVKTHTILRSP
jgi:hypothetical protein